VKCVELIGLGALGCPMARNLAGAGFELAVFDVGGAGDEHGRHGGGGGARRRWAFRCSTPQCPAARRAPATGELLIMAGGGATENALGATVVHCGERPGDGQAVKGGKPAVVRRSHRRGRRSAGLRGGARARAPTPPSPSAVPVAPLLLSRREKPSRPANGRERQGRVPAPPPPCPPPRLFDQGFQRLSVLAILGARGRWRYERAHGPRWS
jgi:hypothetical protein